MKDDQLEDFIRHNRSAFDDREPSGNVWRRIEASLGFARTRVTGLVWWRAAAIFFMMLSAGLFIWGQVADQTSAVSARQEARVLEEFSDVEAFYTQQISHKVELINEFSGSDGVNGFTQDFQQLEAMYHVLKEEMKSRPSKKVKDALVLNLLVRIDLLNQQLHRLEEKKETEERKT